MARQGEVRRVWKTDMGRDYGIGTLIKIKLIVRTAAGRKSRAGQVPES